VQALTELGEFEEAEGVTARLAELAERQSHPWATITAERCRSVVRLAGLTPDADAADALERAAAEYETLGLHFDAARSVRRGGRSRPAPSSHASARGARAPAVS
jgi:hypothetical protein